LVLIVADGLRADFVTQRETPNVYNLSRQGVRFARHHAVFPTLTTVNASALSTGATPAESGIIANTMFFGPALKLSGAFPDAPAIRSLVDAPAKLERSSTLALLNGRDAFAGRLLGVDTIAQQVLRSGGYVAAIGKRGPTFLFDNRVATVSKGIDLLKQPHKNYLVLSDDFAAPPELAGELLKPFASSDDSRGDSLKRDDYCTRVAIDRAIPAAKAASDEGRIGFILLWLRNPDATQHRSGLGTVDALNALAETDSNVGKVRAAIAAAGIDDRTDVIVAADHGFATIFLTVDLAGMLTAAGIKQSRGSSDVLVVSNGGADLIYVANDKYPTPEARRDKLQKIVNFALAQEWCGPIFTREYAPAATGRRATPKPYLGWVDGTFAQGSIGLLSPTRAPDLVISFREIATRTNTGLTGPGNPAFALGANGQVSIKNKSQELVKPTKGLTYADTGEGGGGYTTGMGMHGAAGKMQIGGFLAAAGPSFKSGFVNNAPTSSFDVAPTIAEILGVGPLAGSGNAIASGRVMGETLKRGGRGAGRMRTQTWTATAVLQGMRVDSKLKISRIGDLIYLDDSEVNRVPHGSSP
ncbi:MAG: alkaline phosphatase family protein, partial [Candidatus Binataceae bacterium]